MINKKKRAEKLLFIKGIMNGKNKISEIYENKVERFIHDDNEPGKYYRSRSKGEYLTEVQLNDFRKKYPWKDILIIRIIHKNSTIEN